MRIKTTVASLICITLVVGAAISGASPPPPVSPHASRSMSHIEGLRCSLAPLPTHAVVEVLRDTMLAFGGGESDVSTSDLGARRSGQRLTRDTPMPAGRVRLMALDSATRAQLANEGITAREPEVYLKAAPYGPDCRGVMWRDSTPFVVPGERGYVRAMLTSREAWIGTVPVLLVPDAWSYPYPRRRPYGVADTATLASPDARFAVELMLFRPLRTAAARPGEEEVREQRTRTQVMAWAAQNTTQANREPLRSIVRNFVLESDWRDAERTPSRLRGTYRVEVRVNSAVYIWSFRTQPQLAYRLSEIEAQRSTDDVLASPHIAGYRLVGTAADSLGNFAFAPASRANRASLVWLSVQDRPTAPGNDVRRHITSVLEFVLAGSPREIWDAVEPFAPGLTPRDSLAMERMGRARERGDKQPRLPMTLVLDDAGAVHGDTSFTVTVNGARRQLRVSLLRMDTLTTPRRF